MKKVLAILAAVVALAACTKEVKVSEVKVEPNKVDIVVGGKQLLKATVLPAEATTTESVVWASSNTAVATVAPTGMVTAVAPGTADITASIDGQTGRCAVTVTDTEIASISFKNASDKAIVVAPGDTKELELVFSPEDATNKAVKWVSSDEKIATVTPDAAVSGKAAVKFAGASGIVEITATTEISAKTATQAFLVLGADKLYVLPDEVVAGKAATFKLNTAAYKGLTGAVWTVGDKKFEGDEAAVVLDGALSFEEALAGAELAPVTVKLSATIGGNEVSDTFEVPVKMFWMVQEIETWSRNSNPVFNKECTKVYFITRNSDTGVNKRQLVQIDLASKEVKYVDLKQDKESIKTDNGGCFCVNPKTGDVICCNNQAIYCFTEGLAKKWQFDVPGTNANSGASVLVGCGPAMSNNCDVVFAPCSNHKLYALNAETGAEISSLDFGTSTDCLDKSKKYAAGLSNCQLAVWGENSIVLHRNTNSKSMHWITFKNDKLAIEKESNSVSGSLADITTPVVDKTQTNAYFGGNSTVLTVPVKGFNDALHLTGGATGTGLQFSGAICDGYLYFGAQVKSHVSRVDLAGPTTGFVTNVLDTPAQDNNNRNFDVVVADAEGYIYFPYKSAGKAMLMCKGKTADDGSFSSQVIAACPLSGGNYQGSCNMGSGYMVLCCRNAAGNPTVYVRCIGAKRANGWSGFGGDACATKNANLVWAE